MGCVGEVMEERETVVFNYAGPCPGCGGSPHRASDPKPTENCVVTEIFAVPTTEADVLLRTFHTMLQAVTGDGQKKRQAGTKAPWWRDRTHEQAIFSHLNRWKHGELVDKDSGAHPLVHLAWRALSIAYQETHGLVDPEEKKA